VAKRNEVSGGSGCLSLFYISFMRYRAVAWRVEILDERVAAEIAALPADMQARLLRLAERIASAGLQSLGEPGIRAQMGPRLTFMAAMPISISGRGETLFWIVN
jgi:hypothetical protein